MPNWGVENNWSLSHFTTSQKVKDGSKGKKECHSGLRPGIYQCLFIKRIDPERGKYKLVGLTNKIVRLGQKVQGDELF